MVTESDLIRLAYSPDLTEAGIMYVTRWLVSAQAVPEGPFGDTIHSIVVQKAVELAFRRYLGEMQVPIQTASRITFTQPEAVELVLGGWRVDLVTTLLDNRETIRQVHSKPSVLLNAEALLPSELVVGELPGERRVYIFAYVTGLVAHNWNEVHRAQLAGQPVYFLRLLPKEWSQPKTGYPSGSITITAEEARTIRLAVGGRSSDGHFLSEQLTLPPGIPVIPQQNFNSLTYLHPEKELVGRIDVVSPMRKLHHRINPGEWSNAWVYGSEIYLCGYISHAEFSRRSRRVSPGSRLMQSRRVTQMARSLAISELYPIEDLLASAATR